MHHFVFRIIIVVFVCYNIIHKKICFYFEIRKLFGIFDLVFCVHLAVCSYYVQICKSNLGVRCRNGVALMFSKFRISMTFKEEEKSKVSS